jgi:Ca2+-binding EF-hand superfamily protein
LPEIGLSEFYEIAGHEATISEREIIDAFRAIDVNGNGYISYNEFLALFTREGDALEPREVKKLMMDADLNNDKKIDYREVIFSSFFRKF